MNIVRIDHVQLAMPTNGEDDARRFYGDVLGFTEVPKPKPLASRGGCWFEGPSVGIHLGVDADFVPARKAHPAFQVADLAAFQAMLDRVGVLIRPDSSLPNVRRFYVDDPFGNRIEFMQAGDVFLTHRSGG